MAGGENPSRAYRSTLRERQARETRRRVVHAAGALFSRHGFQTTTMAAIASEAGVSTETVKATASKAELLVAAFELAFAEAEGEHTLADTPVVEGIAELPAAAFLPAVLEGIATANARGHALWTVVLGAALSDEGVDVALRRILRRRHDDYARLVAELAARGAHVDDPARAAAELSFLLSPEGYQQLVEQSGWTRAQYVSWLADSVARVIGDTR